MCAHNASGHGIGSQAVCTPYTVKAFILAGLKFGGFEI